MYYLILEYCIEYADQFLILDAAGHVQVQPNESRGNKPDNMPPFLAPHLAQSRIQPASSHEATAKEMVDELAVAQEDTLRRKGNSGLYVFYFNSAKPWMVLTFIVTCILAGVAEVLPSK